MLSPSLGNDYILPVLSPPCSFHTGLHASSPHTEGAVRGGPAPSSALASVLLEDMGRAELPPRQVCLESGCGWGKRRLSQECSEVPCGLVSLCWLAAACRFLMRARIRGWSQNPSGAVVWEVRILVLFWVSGSPGSAEKPLNLASSPSSRTRCQSDRSRHAQAGAAVSGPVPRDPVFLPMAFVQTSVVLPAPPRRFSLRAERVFFPTHSFFSFLN